MEFGEKRSLTPNPSPNGEGSNYRDTPYFLGRVFVLFISKLFPTLPLSAGEGECWVRHIGIVLLSFLNELFVTILLFNHFQ